MKKVILLTSLLIMMLVKPLLIAQNVGISTSATFTPDPSSMLDISSTNSGVLVPRIALTQTSSSSPVTSPAASLLVYNTATVNDVTPGYYYWGGSAWIRVATGSPVNSITGTAPVVVTGASSPTVSLQGNAGTVCYGTGGGSSFSAAGTSGQVLTSNGTGAPSWTTKYETAGMNFYQANSLVNPYYYTASVTSAYHAVFTGAGGWTFPTGTTAAFNPASTTQNTQRIVESAGNSSFVFPYATTLTSLNVIGKFYVASNAVTVNATTNPTFNVLVVKFSPGTTSNATASTTVFSSGTLLGSSGAINATSTTADYVYNIAITTPISIAAGDVIGVWFDYAINSTSLSTTAINFYGLGSMTWKQAQ